MRVLSAVLTLIVALSVGAKLYAAEEKTPGKRGAEAWGMGMFRDLELTADQKAKIEEVRKQYGPKIQEAMKKMGDVLTAEQKKAREDATKAARDAGKKGRELWEATQSAIKLTDAQKKTMDDARKEMEAVGKEMRDKISAVLTPEQREKVEKAIKAGKAKFEKRAEK